MASDSSELHEFEVYGTKFKVPKKYVPIKALGKGAYGVVCAAKNRETGGKVAIKRITPMCASAVDGKHTLRELRMLRHLGVHPNIIAMKDVHVNVDEDELYVMMELFDTDLHKIIQSPQPLGDAHFKHFMFQLLRGLRFAHRYDVIHRDLKPANLLVTKNCDLAISDFGLARQMPDTATHKGASPLMTEHVVTRWYRAPELMLSADGNYTQSVDVWAAGCVFAELLGRAPLFAGKDFMETITMQINVLGTRPPEELTYIRSDQALHFLAAMPYKPTVPWSTLFADASEKALDLLDKMLQFHPSKRVSVEGAMAHPYFDSVRSQYTDPEPLLPLGPGGFDFSFEYEEGLEVADFRRLIIEEAASFKAERALARKVRGDKAGEDEDMGTGGGQSGLAAGVSEDDVAGGHAPVAAGGRFYSGGAATVVRPGSALPPGGVAAARVGSARGSRM